MALYQVRKNSLDQLEAIKISGNESVGLGHEWVSDDTFVSIKDCNNDTLGYIEEEVAIGLNASAANTSVAIGCGSASCCNGIAINGTANDTDAIAIGATAASDTVAIGNKVVVDTNAVIIGKCTTGLSCSVAIGANTTAQCGVSVGFCSSSLARGVAIGPNSRANGGVSIGSNAGWVYAPDAILIGDGSGGECCSIAIGTSTTSCENGVAIGTLVGTGIESVAIGNCSTAMGCYGIALGSEALADDNEAIAIGHCAYACSNTIAIGNGVETDTDCAGDTFIGCGSNIFKFCGETGYTYGNGCMMTGRILNCAAELPATNCELLLYYVD